MSLSELQLFADNVIPTSRKAALASGVRAITTRTPPPLKRRQLAPFRRFPRRNPKSRNNRLNQANLLTQARSNHDLNPHGLSLNAKPVRQHFPKLRLPNLPLLRLLKTNPVWCNFQPGERS